MKSRPVRYSARKVLTVLLLLVMLPVWSQQNEYATPEDLPTFQLHASQSQYLPPAMYGTWSIHATVLKSNAPPWLHAPAATELWTLAKEGDEITLKNIVTNASASIQVDKVEGDTATFHHVANAPTRRIQVVETPTVTVDGDHLSGINRQSVILFDRKGNISATYDLEIRIEGTRLAGAKVTFGNSEEPPLEFEVAPIQFQD